MLKRDFTAYSEQGDTSFRRWWDAEYWEGLLNKHGLGSGNADPPSHDWTREQSEGVSIMDLMLAN